MSRDGWAALPRGATGLSAVCDCGISWSYSLTIFSQIADPIIFWQESMQYVHNKAFDFLKDNLATVPWLVYTYKYAIWFLHRC